MLLKFIARWQLRCLCVGRVQGPSGEEMMGMYGVVFHRVSITAATCKYCVWAHQFQVVPKYNNVWNKRGRNEMWVPAPVRQSISRSMLSCSSSMTYLHSYTLKTSNLQSSDYYVKRIVTWNLPLDSLALPTIYSGHLPLFPCHPTSGGPRTRAEPGPSLPTHRLFVLLLSWRTYMHAN